MNTNVIASVKNEALYYFGKFKKLLIPIGILSLIYVFSFLAIFKADFLYLDDMGRTYQGLKGWEYFSRYLSNFLSRFFSIGNYLTDVSPLTQIVACVFLATSGIVVLHVLTEKTKFSFFEYLSALLIGISPYFLECISYKYDSPYMALSILASVLPLVFYKKNRIFYCFTVFIGMLTVCMTYQAASGIFPMFVAFIVFDLWNKEEKTKKILNFLLSSVVGYLAGLIVFRVFIMTPVSNYNSTHLLGIDTIIPSYFGNLKKYFTFVKNDFRVEWLVLIIVIAVAFVYVFVRDSKKKKIVSLIASLILIAAMVLVCFGVYPFMEDASFYARAMYPFGVMVSFIAVRVASSTKIYLGKISVLALCWMFVVFSFSYGNALNVQKTYTDFRISQTINDLTDLDLLDGESEKKVQIKGTIGYAPSFENMPDDYDMMIRLVPVTFCDSGWYWGYFGFLHYYGLDNIVIDNSEDYRGLDLPVLEDNIYHTIRSDGERILIELK